MLRSVSAFMILLAFSPARADEPDFDRAVKPLLAKHCTACHGAEKPKGEIRLDGAAPDFVNAKTRAVWEKVHSMLVRGEMPPREKTKLTTDELDVLTTWIRRGIERGVLSDRGGAGRATMRRLTRVEYARLLEDVLGLRYANVPLKLAEKLPTDPQSEAPLNDGDLLAFQSLHLRSYVDLAERAVSAVLASEPRQAPFTYRIDPRSLKQSFIYGKMEGLTGKVAPLESTKAAKPANVSLGAVTRTDDGALLLSPIYRFDSGYLGRDGVSVGCCAVDIPYIPPAGILHVRVWAGAIIPKGESAPVLRVALHNGVVNQRYNRQAAAIPVTNPADKLQVYDFEIPLDLFDFPYVLFERAKNIGLRISNDAMPIADRKSPVAEKGKQPKWPWQEPQLVIDSIEVIGPGTAEWPPRRHRELVAAGEKAKTDRERAAAILADVAAKAWRRPVAGGELTPFVKLYDERRKAGDGPDAALFQPLAAVLVSPYAIYLIERKAETIAPLTGIELANRLSMFLWGSGPDTELLRLAADGTLRDPKILARQVERMLDHPRKGVFTEDFVVRLLALDRVVNDPIDFKLTAASFGNEKVAALRESLIKRDLALEPVRYFENALQKNRPVLDLIGSKTLVVNDRLARYYGIPDVEGGEFREVSAPAERRAGWLSMAGVMAAASRGNKEAAIHRGVYLLQRILGEHPGTPPGNVEPLEVQAKVDAKRAKLTVREQVKLHTSINTCQLCHRKIDPLGFVWADFDYLGLKIVPKAGKTAVSADCSGKFPDARSFKNLEEFAANLRDESSPSRFHFGEVFVRQLTGYALGRPLNLNDDGLVRELVQSSRNDGWRLRAMIRAIVLSKAFTHG